MAKSPTNGDNVISSSRQSTEDNIFDDRTLEKIFEMVKDEYDAEITRFSGYEVRTGILFAVTAALFPVLLSNFHAPSLKLNSLALGLIYFLEVSAVLSTVYSGARFFLLLRARPVQRLSTTEWLENVFLTLGYKRCLLTLIKTYDTAISTTRTQTAIRTKHFQHGLGALSYAVSSSVLAVLLLMNIK